MMISAIGQETLSEPDVAAGSWETVSNELSFHAKDASFVAVALPGSDEAFAAQVSKAVVEVMKEIGQVLKRQRDLDVAAYLAVMLPKEVPTGTRLQEMKMLAAGMRAVLESGDFVTSSQIASLCNFSEKNPSAQPSKWKRDKAIFSISYQREDRFPLYALQPSENFRPHPMLKKIIELFDGKKDGWAMALWFLADNSYLGGRRPQDVLATDPEAVLAAAGEEVSEVLHG